MDVYIPGDNQEKQLEVLAELVEASKKLGINISIFGGYGLDGLYGSLTRDHHDIDVLVSSEQRNDLVQVALDMGFYEHKESWGKKKYKRKDLGDVFYVEVVTPEKLQKFMEVGEQELFPAGDAAHLGNTVFKTPTLKGHKYVHEVQTKVAKEKGWEEYRHKENKEKLFDILSNA